MKPCIRAIMAFCALAVLSGGVAWADYADFSAVGGRDIGNIDDSTPVPTYYDPSLPGNYTYDSAYSVDGKTVKMYTLAGGGSDWWDAGECGFVTYGPNVAGDWRIVANVAIADNGGPQDGWIKAGVFARKDLSRGAGDGLQKQPNAIAAATWSNNGTFQWRVDDSSGMGNTQAGSARPWAVALQRQGDNFTAWVCSPTYDGGAWQQVGTQSIAAMGSTPAVGLFVCAHNNSTLETGYMWNVQMTTNLGDPLPSAVYLPTLQGGLPRTPGNWVQGPDGGPGPGGWGYFDVREVVDNGNIGNVQPTVNSITSGTGHIYNYTASMINILDSGGDGHFGNNAPFGVVTEGYKNLGDVDNLAFLAHGTIRIGAGQGGMWTFGVNSDDGFELAIDGQVVAVADYGRGAADSFGSVNLPEGDHVIQLIYWEGGGGSEAELFAVPGQWSGFGDTTGWQLVGDVANGGIPLVPEPASMVILGLAGLGVLARRRHRS
jgi:hypothetical protein